MQPFRQDQKHSEISTFGRKTSSIRTLLITTNIFSAVFAAICAPATAGPPQVMTSSYDEIFPPKFITSGTPNKSKAECDATPAWSCQPHSVSPSYYAAGTLESNRASMGYETKVHVSDSPLSHAGAAPLSMHAVRKLEGSCIFGQNTPQHNYTPRKCFAALALGAYSMPSS